MQFWKNKLIHHIIKDKAGQERSPALDQPDCWLRIRDIPFVASVSQEILARTSARVLQTAYFSADLTLGNQRWYIKLSKGVMESLWLSERISQEEQPRGRNFHVPCLSIAINGHLRCAIQLHRVDLRAIRFRVSICSLPFLKYLQQHIRIIQWLEVLERGRELCIP